MCHALRLPSQSGRRAVAATGSSSARSAAPNAAGRSLSMSISPSTSSPCMIGTTISDCVSMLHARYRGSAFTSSTTMVAFSVAAAPQMPRPSGMRVCGDGLPTKRPEHELVAVEQVDADPGVVRDGVLEEPDRLLHGGRRRSGARRDRRARSRRSARIRRLVHVSHSLISQKISARPPSSGTSWSAVEAVQAAELDAPRVPSGRRRRGDADRGLRVARCARRSTMPP